MSMREVRDTNPLLAKQNRRFCRLCPFVRFLMFSTVWGICFLLKTNPNALNTTHPCTVRAQASTILFIDHHALKKIKGRVDHSFA